jgi:hypothetical protein
MGRKSRRHVPSSPKTPNTPNSAFASILSNEVLDVTQIRLGKLKKGDRYTIADYETMTSNDDESDRTPTGSMMESDDDASESASSKGSRSRSTSYSDTSASAYESDIVQEEEDESADDDTAFLDRRPTESFVSPAADSFPFLDSLVDGTCGWLDRQTMCVNFVTGDTGKGSSLLRESRLHAHGIQPKRLEGLKTSMILAATEENKRSKRLTRLGLLDMNKEESGDIVITASTDPKHHKDADGKIHKKTQVHAWKNRIRSMRSEESITSVTSGESGHRGPRIKLTRTEDRHGVAVLTVATDASETDDSDVDGEAQGDNSEVEEQELSEGEGTKAADEDSNRDNAAEDNSKKMQASQDEQPDGDEDGDKQDGKDEENHKGNDSIANSNHLRTGKPQLGVRTLGVRTERVSLKGEAKSNNNSERASDKGEERKSARSERSFSVSITDLTHLADFELPAHPSRANSPMKALAKDKGPKQGTVMEVLEIGGDLTLTPKGRDVPPPTRPPGKVAAPQRHNPTEEEPFVNPVPVEQSELTGRVSNLWEEEEAKLRQVVQQQRTQENQDNVPGFREASDEDDVVEAGGDHRVSDLASRANMIWAEEEQKVAQQAAVDPSDAKEHEDKRHNLEAAVSFPHSKSKTDIPHDGPSDDIVRDASVRTRDSRFKNQPRPKALETKNLQIRRGSGSAATTQPTEDRNADGRRNQSDSRDSSGHMVFDSAMNLGLRQKALGSSDHPGALRAEGQEDEHASHLSRRRARSHDLRGHNVNDKESQKDTNMSRTSRRSRSQDLRGPNAADENEDAQNHRSQNQGFLAGNVAPEEDHDDTTRQSAQGRHKRGSKSADLRDQTFVDDEDDATLNQLLKSKSGIVDPSNKSTRRFDTPVPLERKSKIQDLRNAILDVQQNDIRRVDPIDMDMSVSEQSMRRSKSRDPRDSSFADTRGQEVPSSPQSRASKVSGGGADPDSKSHGLRSANESYGRVLHETKSREMRRTSYDAPESIAGRSTHEKELEPTQYDMPDTVLHPSRSRDSRRETKYEGPDAIVRPSRSRGDLIEVPRGRDLHEPIDYPDQMVLGPSKSRGSIRGAPSRGSIRDSRSREQEYSIRTPKSRELRDARGRNQSHSEYGVRSTGSRSDLSRREADEYGVPISSSRSHHHFEAQEDNETTDYNGLRSPSFLGVRQSYDGGAPDLGASSRGSLQGNGQELGIRATRSRGEYGAYQSYANVQRYDDDLSRTSRASNYDEFGSIEHVIRPTRSRGMRGEPIDVEDYETRNAMSSRESRRSSSSHLAAAEDEFDRYREERDEKSRGSRFSSSKSITSTSGSSRFTEEQLVAAKELRKLEKKLEKQLKHLKRDKDDRSRTSTDLRQIEKQLERKLKREDEKRASRLKRLRKKSQEVVKPGTTSTTEVNVVHHYQPSSGSIQERVRVDHEIQTIAEKAEELRVQAKEARSRAMGLSSVSPAPGRITAPSPMRPTTTGFYSSKPNRTRRQQLDHLRSSLRGKEI